MRAFAYRLLEAASTMPERTFRISEGLRLRVAAEGESGARWLRGLGARVAALERAWDVRIGDSFEGGSESLVLSATCGDGAAAILKLGLPGTSNLAQEAHVYRIAAGRGYANLLAHDDEHNALLLERLGRPVADLGLPLRTEQELICQTLHEAWIALTDASGLMTGADKARWLAQFIAKTWSALDVPCPRSTIDLALEYADDRLRAYDPAKCLLVHGDGHEYNTLLSPDPPVDGVRRCKFIDPDGLFAEPAYDLGVLMRGGNDELLEGDAIALGHARCAALSAWAGVEPTPIWQWGFIERVSTGLLMTQLGMDGGRETLAIAQQWALAV